MRSNYLLPIYVLLLGLLPFSLEASSFPFSFGVASGDADASSLVIWTRLDDLIAMPHQVSYEVAYDADFNSVVKSESFIVEDQFIKVLVEGLSSGCIYYRFRAAGFVSATGRAEIIEDGQAVTFAAFSCADHQRGYFHVYDHALQANEADYLLFLGDYYYDNAPSEAAVDVEGREHDPPYLPRTRDDFELRWKQYRGNALLQELHRQYASYVIWDDHEFADDCWRDAGENISGDEWEELKRNAVDAWYDWMPVRDREADFASAELGPAKLILTETRIRGRDEVLPAGDPGTLEEGRSLLGIEQEEWFATELDHEKPWTILLSGVPVMPQLYNGLTVRPHAWDGYPAARDRLQEAIEGSNAKLLVLSGDMHAARVADLATDTYDPTSQTGTWGIELTAPPVTSLVRQVPDSSNFADQNEHIRYFEESHRGYLKLRVSETSVLAQFIWVSSVTEDDAIEFTVGPKFLSAADVGGIAPTEDGQFEENDCALLSAPVVMKEQGIATFLVFPNPTNDEAFLAADLSVGEFQVQVVDASGKQLHAFTFIAEYGGSHIIQLNSRHLAQGVYTIQMEGVDYNNSVRMVIGE
ncbi:alkaline phosphatase D family protein [Sanyastnella coralliicola]|uniref:alkaline phosphatase D family protein n=1 Tax=Sanyastnella coralliicola TaxID=3069118 RepID=UPI0027B9306E|nr:alkaline phosphatase D family protein [Longitalea sp. SCSIO 12813]